MGLYTVARSTHNAGLIDADHRRLFRSAWLGTRFRWRRRWPTRHRRRRRRHRRTADGRDLDFLCFRFGKRDVVAALEVFPTRDDAVLTGVRGQRCIQRYPSEFDAISQYDGVGGSILGEPHQQFRHPLLERLKVLVRVALELIQALPSRQVPRLDEVRLRGRELPQFFLAIGQIHEGFGLAVQPHAFHEVRQSLFALALLLESVPLLELRASCDWIRGICPAKRRGEDNRAREQERCDSHDGLGLQNVLALTRRFLGWDGRFGERRLPRRTRLCKGRRSLCRGTVDRC